MTFDLLCRLTSAVGTVSRALSFWDTVKFSVPGLPKAVPVAIDSLVGREGTLFTRHEGLNAAL